MFKGDSSEIVKQSVITGLLQVVYIFVIGTFLLVAGRHFPTMGARSVLGPLAMMTLMVASVTITAVLMFGHPIAYIMNKKFDEAMLSIAINLGVLFIFFVLILFAVIMV